MDVLSREYALAKSLFNQSNKWPTIIFLSIFVISIITGIFVIRQNVFSEQAFNEQHENVEEMIFLSKAEKALEKIRINTIYYMVEGTAEREKIKQDFTAQLNDLQLNLALCKKTEQDPKIIETFDLFDKEFFKYLKIRSSFLQLIDEFKTKEAYNSLFKLAKPSGIKLSETLRELMSQEQLQTHQRSIKVVSRVEKTRRLTYHYLFLEIFLSLGLFKSIAHSQKDLELKIQTLSHNSKMASLGEMSGNIAHEINNPLAIIKGRSSIIMKLIQSDNLSRDDITVNLDRIFVATDRIMKIIRSMKSISRNADNDPFISVELQNLNENVQTISSERLSSKGITLDVGVVPDLSIECRPAEIEQVILNLFNNAFDAITPLPEKWISIDFKKVDEQIRISVTDSGKGIPPEIVKKLMFPFFTTKEVGLGTGLGLSISKSIVEAHQGRLFYDSTCSNTRFIIELPLKQTKEILRVA